jgi:DNA-binding transcriptional regulator LsrR (DeoR family)
LDRAIEAEQAAHVVHNVLLIGEEPLTGAAVKHYYVDGLTQEEIAAQLSKNHTTIGRWLGVFRRRAIEKIGDAAAI